MDIQAKGLTALLGEKVNDYSKAYDALKSSRYFNEWYDAREDMRLAVGAMSGIIDQLVIQYNAMAKACGVTNHKDIVENIELSIMGSSTHKAM